MKFGKGICPTCGRRPVDFTKKGTRLGRCRQCHNEAQSLWHRENPTYQKTFIAKQRAIRRENKRLALKQHRSYSPKVQQLYDAAFNIPYDQSEPCIDFDGTLSDLGYGQVWHFGRRRYAHEVVLELTLGRAIEKAKESFHTCNRPQCIARWHLLAKTHKDNMMYASQCGRMNTGGKHLTKNQVLLVRELWAQGKTTGEISDITRIPRRRVRHITNGTHYRKIA